MTSETNRIEYKLYLTDDLEKEAVAFFNYHEGGIIYIGVHKTGTPIGKSPRKSPRKLKNSSRFWMKR